MCCKNLDWSLIVNSIIAIAAIMTLISQKVINRRILDFTYHPLFQVYEFDRNLAVDNWTPKLCKATTNPKSKHQCNLDHWFNITNRSIGTAFNMECFIIHVEEINKELSKKKLKELKSKGRLRKDYSLFKDNFIEYKIPKETIPFHLYKMTSTSCFFLVIEYTTITKSIHYRQIFQLDYEPVINESQISDWKGAIKFYSAQVDYFSTFSILNNYSKLLKSLNLLKNM